MSAAPGCWVGNPDWDGPEHPDAASDAPGCD